MRCSNGILKLGRTTVALLAIISGTCLQLPAAASEVLFANFELASPPTDWNNGVENTDAPNPRHAFGFVNTKGAATLDTLSIAIVTFENELETHFDLSLHRDNNGIPGEILETWLVNISPSGLAGPPPVQILTVTSAVKPVLSSMDLHWLSFASDKSAGVVLGGRRQQLIPGVALSRYYPANSGSFEEGWFTSDPPKFEWIMSGDSQVLSGGTGNFFLNVTGNPVPVPPALTMILPAIIGWGVAVARLNLRANRL